MNIDTSGEGEFVEKFPDDEGETKEDKKRSLKDEDDDDGNINGSDLPWNEKLVEKRSAKKTPKKVLQFSFSIPVLGVRLHCKCIKSC